MTRRTLLLVAVLALVPAIRLVPPAPSAQQAAASRLPARLSGSEFFKLSAELSEAGGYFRSDNLVSNEQFMQRVIPELTRTVKAGGAYLGVGPEQNFTYIAAIRPAMAFIIDIRRGNPQLHLMYKALFELSSDRADFVSRLFSLKRPAGLTRKSTVEEIFSAYRDSRLQSRDVDEAESSGDQAPLHQTDSSGTRSGRSESYRRHLRNVLHPRAGDSLRGHAWQCRRLPDIRRRDGRDRRDRFRVVFSRPKNRLHS